jgi:hypothetical protein
VARISRVGPKGHGDAFDLQAGLIGGQRSDAKAVSDISGEMQGKRLGIDLEALEKGFQEHAASALSGFARPQDVTKTGQELSEDAEVGDATMKRVEDIFTPKSVRDRERRLSDEARLIAETREAITQPEAEEDDWEQVPDVEDVYADWGPPAEAPRLTAGDILDRQDALDEIHGDEDGE